MPIPPLGPRPAILHGKAAVFSRVLTMDLRPFQRRFVRAATAPGIDTAALSLPRGNGKSLSRGAPRVARITRRPTIKLFRARYGVRALRRLALSRQESFSASPARLLEPSGAYSLHWIRILESESRHKAT